MKYKDEIKIGIMTACFCCAMVMVYAVVPKDASVLRARATSTFKEAPETAAEKQSEAEDAGFTIYSKDSNYDYDTSDDSGSSDTSSSDADTTQNDDGSSDVSHDDNTSSDDYINEDDNSGDYNTSDQITYPTDDGSDSSHDDSSSDDVQTDYDTGGSDSSDDSSGSFEENLVQEETYY